MGRNRARVSSAVLALVLSACAGQSSGDATTETATAPPVVTTPPPVTTAAPTTTSTTFSVVKDDELADAVTADPVDGVTVEIHSAADVVLAGSDFSASLVINNSSGQRLEILDDGCAPKWTLALGTGDPSTASSAFTMECSLEPVVVPVGESMYPVKVLSTHAGCAADEPNDSDIPSCVGSPPRLPPLPAGDYELVVTGSLPGLPLPAPAPVRLVDTLGIDTPAADPRKVPVAEGFAYLENGVVVTDLTGRRSETVDLPPAQPGFAQLLYVNGDDVFVTGGQQLHVIVDGSVSTIDVGGIAGPFEQEGYWVSRWTGPQELIGSFTRYDGEVTTTFTSSGGKKVIVGSYGRGAITFDLSNAQIEYMVADTDPIVLSRGTPLVLSDNLLYVWAGEDIVEHDLDSGARRSLGAFPDRVTGATFGAAGLSPDRSRLAMVVKNPDDYEVVGLALIDLATGSSSTVQIDRGAQVTWVDDDNVVLFGGTSAYVLDVDTGASSELATDADYLGVLWAE